VVDELDDQLGKVIGRCGFPGEEERMGSHLEARIPPQPVVEHHDVQHVEQLALVLVDALDLAVEDRFGVHDRVVRCLQPADEGHLACALGLADLCMKPCIPRERQQLAQLRCVADPSVTDRFRDQPGQRRIGLLQPAAWRHSVGLVVEAIWKQLGKIAQHVRAQKPRMDLGDTVGAV
jgi:hypothetical protein